MDDKKYLDSCISYLGFGTLKCALKYSLNCRRDFSEYTYHHESNEDIVIFQAHKEYYQEICPHELNYYNLDGYYIGDTHMVNMYHLNNKFSLKSTKCICVEKITLGV